MRMLSRPTPRRAPIALLASLLAVPLAAQETRPLALVNARILTMTDDGTVENGTILVRDGLIEAAGADVTVPPGARVIDLDGGTVMPGLVHAWSRAGAGAQRAPNISALPPEIQRRMRPRGGSSRGGNAVIKASAKVAESLYARQDVFGELLAQGVTTLVVRPDAVGFPGLAARIAPAAKTQDQLTLADEVYLVVAPAPSPKATKVMKDALEKAAKVLEERKKPKEAPKPAEEEKPAEGKKPTEKKEGEKPEPKEGEKPPEKEEGEKPKPEEAPKPAPQDAKPAKKPEPKKDPNIEVLADLLDGKRKAFLRMSSAMAIQHFKSGFGEQDYPAVLVADGPNARQGFLTAELEWLKARTKIVLLPPKLDQVPYTRTLVNVPAELQAAGLEIGFLLSDRPTDLRSLTFQLMELVRCGLPAEAALRGVTAVPAKALGLEKEVGAIAPGLRADLLVFSGDPLNPSSSLRHVFLKGHEVVAPADR